MSKMSLFLCTVSNKNVPLSVKKVKKHQNKILNLPYIKNNNE